jgi:hypothetical protein
MPLENMRVSISKKKPFEKELGLRENDVYMITLEKK